MTNELLILDFMGGKNVPSISWNNGR